MGLGLAGPTKKERIGFDPRNTTWSNDTDRFGHQHMLNMGWKPGQGLGKTIKGDLHHVKVRVKADNVGLGRPSKADLPTGLDVFQRILGKLNGEEEKVNRQLNEQMKRDGVFLNFVYGGVLEGTVEKMALTLSEEASVPEKPSKRKASDAEDEPRSPRKKSKKSKSSSEEEKKSKANRKEKKSKKKESKDKSEKKEKKEKKREKKEKKREKELKRESSQSPAPMGIRATRSRFIAMKRQATTDEKSLKEILMLT